MSNFVFKPAYTFKSLWDVLLLSIVMVFSLIFSFLIQGANLLNLLGSVFLVCFCFMWLHDLIRRIVFASSSFCVEYYFQPTKEIEYSDVVDFRNASVVTRSSDISVAGMGNGSELLTLFQDLIEDDKIHLDQLESKIISEAASPWKSVVPSLLISLPLCAGLLHFWPLSHNWIGGIDSLVCFVEISAPLNWIIHWFIRRRANTGST